MYSLIIIFTRISFITMVGNLGLKPRSLFRRRIYSNHRNILRTRSLPTPFSNEKAFASGAFINSASFPYLNISIIHADLRPTSIIFVFIQSVRRRSLSFGERPLTSGPSLSTKSHAGMITYNFHPPFRNVLNSIISINPIKN